MDWPGNHPLSMSVESWAREIAGPTRVRAVWAGTQATMATTRAALTQEDIRTLVKGATVDERAAAAHKLCRAIETLPLGDEERDTAGEILRIMAADAAELVRRTLAVTLKASPLVPRDVALRLARDVETISLPLLNFSPSFSDDDLAEIVRLGGPVRQLAIARRPGAVAHRHQRHRRAWRRPRRGHSLRQ